MQEKLDGRCGVKRKRTQNTTPDQYLLYIETMENDYIFRSGTIDPTIAPDYLDNKWEELCLRLNMIEKGPALTKQAWQKRFKDWKNATRAKYRKLVVCKKATGGATCEVNAELTPLEERGLEVWGKVAVTGPPLGNMTVGIVKPAVSEQGVGNLNECNNFEFINVITEEPDIKQEEDTEAVITLEDPPQTEDVSAFCLPQNKSQKGKSKSSRFPLNQTAEELKKLFNEHTQVLSSISNSLTLFVEEYKRKGNIEERRLNFEIEKFKYEHKGFIFEK